jgi:CubicO group peptidase (beta-lactamase class C family)
MKMRRRELLAAGVLAGVGATAMMGGDGVEAAKMPGEDWETSKPEKEGMSAEKLATLQTYLGERGTRSTLALRNGRVVAEWLWEGSTATTKFPVYSITKSFAATAVGFLATDGKLRLDQPAADFLPEWAADDRKGITVRHLVCMSSGVANDDAGRRAAADVVGFSVKQPLAAPPGTKWDYNNAACAALSVVVREAAGVEMSTYLKGKLLDPIGIRNYAFQETAGHTIPYSGLEITARDLARFGYLYLQNGKWGGRRLLPASFIREATASSQKLNTGYGYLWWVNTAEQWPELPKSAYAARGAYGNELLVLPEQSLMVVRLVGTKEQAGIDMNRMGALALAACEA